jgi:hypothetical protein
MVHCKSLFFAMHHVFQMVPDTMLGVQALDEESAILDRTNDNLLRPRRATRAFAARVLAALAVGGALAVGVAVCPNRLT